MGEKALLATDEDMLYRATWEGGTSRSVCARDTVVHTHHLGLRRHYEVARASVEADTAEGWISGGTRHLQFVPSRLVPKNVRGISVKVATAGGWTRGACSEVEGDNRRFNGGRGDGLA